MIKLLCLLLCFFGTAFAAPESLAQQTSRDFTTVAKKAIPSVVSIKVKANKGYSYGDSLDDSLNDDDFFNRFFFSFPNMKRRSEMPVAGQASGFIISKDGYIVTNRHVVNEADEIKVLLNDGREFSAKVVGQDPNTDVAVIKIDANELPYLDFGNSDNLEIGEWVIAIGNPLGFQASLTVGVVSAKGRNNLGLGQWEDYIQTDAAINRGNSGGPLLNLDGQVVGMNTAIATGGIGFAIPSNIAQYVMDQIINNGTVQRGFIGVTLQGVDQDLAHAFGLKSVSGALVTDVSKGSPAEKAGLEQGDVIQKYNQQHIANIATLRNAIALMKPGTKVMLSILRNGTPMELPIQVGLFPEGESIEAKASQNKLGFEVQNLNPELAKSLNTSETSGVVVTKVEPTSPAAWVGLKKGTLILAVNKQKVSSVNEFNSVLEKVPTSSPVLLLVKQGDTIQFISLKVE